MKDESDNEKLLIQYLLGNLAEAQRLQIEQEFLSDDQIYEQLLALENQLFYDYAQNKLSPGDREQFEKQFLSSERNRKRVDLASAVARKLSERARAETAENDIASREPRRFWRSPKSYFAARNTALRISLAALAIVSFALVWLVFGTFRMRNEFIELQAQRAFQEDQLRQQAQQESARADELTLKLERKKDENATLRDELNKMQGRSEAQTRGVSTIVSIVLEPSMVRDQALGMRKLYLPPSARLLNLRLKLKGQVEYKSYQVMLLTAEGAEKWTQDMLRPQRTGSGQSIVLSLPAGILAEGDYELRLKGHARDGTLEETGDYYYLSVRSK
jgi:uncharacterized membrane protein YciS (DUF1049 family)